MFSYRKILLGFSSFLVTTTALSAAAEVLTIDGETYQNKSGTNGAALYVNDKQEVNIANTKFLDNTATSKAGGAYIANAQKIVLDEVEFSNNYSKSGGSGLTIVTARNEDAVIDISNTLFSHNQTSMDSSYNRGGALVADGGTYQLNNVRFIENSAGSGGAIFVTNYARLNLKDSLFDGNFSDNSFGGAIVATGGATIIIDNTVFQNNQAKNEYDAGAISLFDGQPEASVEYIKNSKFIKNLAEGDGGAISSSGGIKYIEGSLFEKNESGFVYKGAAGGGAMWMKIHKGYNTVIFNSDFVENKSGKYGGAIVTEAGKNDYLFIVDSSFIGNTAASAGGAIYTTGNLNIFADKKDVLFQGNKAYYGNDIYFNTGNQKDINLAANAGRKIVFDGGIMGSGAANAYVNVNPSGSAETYAVNGGNSYTLSDGKSYTVGSKGEIQFNNKISNVTLNLYDGMMSVGQNAEINAGVANPDGWIDGNDLNAYGGVINSINGVIGTMTFNNLALFNSTGMQVDVDLATGRADNIKATGAISGDGKLVIEKMNVVADTENENVSVVFADDALKDRVSLNVAEVMSDIWKYGVTYNPEQGSFDFVRNGSANPTPDPEPEPTPDPKPDPKPVPVPRPVPTDFNPYVYEKSVVLSYIANIQKTINQMLFNDVQDVQVDFAPESDRGGKGIWIRLSGFDDSYNFKNFDKTDTKTALLTAGITSEPVWFDNVKAKWTVYGGTVQGESKYDHIKIDQHGGYLGTTVAAEKESWVVAGNMTGGILRAHADNMYGTDKFDSYWGAVAVKIGYNWLLPADVVVQPSIHTGWSWIDAKDYTNAAGRRMNSDLMQVWEWAPNIRINRKFASGWNGFVQGRYVFADNKGGKTQIENINLPQIEAKNYAEYGIGIERKTEKHMLEASVYRRDGQREGWSGYLGLRYMF